MLVPRTVQLSSPGSVDYSELPRSSGTLAMCQALQRLLWLVVAALSATDLNHLYQLCQVAPL